MTIWYHTPGKNGIIQDIDPWRIGRDAWSDGRNMRFRDTYAEKFLGEDEEFQSSSASSSITISPMWTINVTTATDNLWLYTSDTEAHCTDGTNHFDITRQDVSGTAVTYNAVESIGWTGTIMGGLGIFSNGVNVPQQWGDASAGPGTGKVCKNLENWDVTASTNCRFIRSFNSFLVAGDITEAGSRNPLLLWWSQPAEAGTVPTSWDYTDPATDSGRKEFSESKDFLVDCLPLYNTNIIYKEHNTWAMEFIGAPDIFGFRRLFPNMGMMSTNCAAAFKGSMHAVLGYNDIWVHDGNTPISIMKSRMKDWFFRTIDGNYLKHSYTVPNYPKDEIWFCFVETGSTRPNLALVWNYAEDTTSVRELSNIPYIAYGIVESDATPDTWGGDTNTWASDSTTWDEQNYNPALLRLLQCKPSTKRLLRADYTNQFDGSNMTSYIQRTGIPLNKDVSDMNVYKHVTRVYPLIDGDIGGVVNIYVGHQDSPRDTVTWTASKTFTIGTDEHIDVMVTGRWIAIKFESTTNIDWKLSGFGIDTMELGSVG